MKTVLFFTLIGSLLWFAPASHSSTLESSNNGAISMKEANFVSCTPAGLCLRIHSPKAFGSALAPIYVLKNVKYKLSTQDGVEVSSGTAVTATVDFSLSNAVLVKEQDGKIVEHVFDLRTLEEQRYEVN